MKHVGTALAALFILLLALHVPAQRKPDKPLQKLPITKSSGAVTSGDFAVAIDRLISAMDGALRIPSRSGLKPTNPGAPLDNKVVVSRLKSTFDHYRPYFRGAPRPILVREDSLNQSPQSARNDLKLLVKWGFVAPTGPLVLNKKLSAADLGKILGHFFSQVTFLTHKPDPKWTPRLNPDG